MKTGKQSNVFDYDTGDWNNTEAVPQDFRIEKPPFAAVAANLLGETLEERLVRLGKIAPRKRVSEEMQREVSPEGFSIAYRKPKRDIRIFNIETEVH